jgi:hypothetical protein
VNHFTPLAVAALVGFLTGCYPGFEAQTGDEPLLVLLDESLEKREEAFQGFLRDEEMPIHRLRAAMGLGGRFGFPVVALLYAQGRGDAVPLDLRARHLAAFEWPRARSRENGVVEPYVRGEIEKDLVRTGRPALRALVRALEEDASSETATLRIVRVMLRIGGRAAAEAFARLLNAERDLGGVRVCDAAAAALLYLGRQETLLRLASPDARLEAARTWWDLAKDFEESEWIREAVEALCARSQPGDPQGVRSVMELFVGQTVEDPKEWWERNRSWKPAAAPLRPEELQASLAFGRARAFDANRRLEAATGVSVHLPRLERVSDLCSALRLWQAPPDLALRWRRYLEAPLLRLSIAAIGHSPSHETLRIRWAYETHFHPLEEDSGELRIGTQTERYAFFVQASDYGTRLVASESHEAGGSWTATLREFGEAQPMVMFSLPFKAALVAVVEEVSSRRTPPPLPAIQSEWRARLRSWKDSPPALHALGYFQDSTDLDLLRERRAGEALLLLGDPAALELEPRLEPHEIERALHKARDPRVKAYLEVLQRRLE